MNKADQGEGARRVKALLIDPLMRRGLAKPSSLTKAQFGEMIDDLCARLAYMDDVGLGALEEQVAANPGGKDRDRLPIAQKVLDWAAVIQPPADDASPLIRAVFANQIGLDALTGGYAPELLSALRVRRLWPGAFVINQAREKAYDAVRRMRDMDARLSRGDDLTPDEHRWRSARQAAIGKCEAIRDLGKRGGA